MSKPAILNNDFPIIYSTPEDATHFFGFHDVSPWNRTDEVLAVLRINEPIRRVPTKKDRAQICLWTPEKGDIAPIGETHAWNWQQGARLQWLPGNSDRLVYNEIIDDTLASVIHDVSTGRQEVKPWPIYSVAPDGRHALSLNFTRLHLYWPAYGYDGGQIGNEDQHKPHDDGIFLLDMETDQVELIVSIADIAGIGDCKSAHGIPHFISHPTYNPSGTRFCFLHRFFTADGALYSRFMVADRDGSNVRLLAEEKCSHFDWLDDETLLVWTRFLPRSVATARRFGFLNLPFMRMLLDRTRKLRPQTKQKLWKEAYFMISLTGAGLPEPVGIGLLEQDGHPAFSKDKRWILTDTYAGPDRYRTLILYDRIEAVRHDIKRLYSPLEFGDLDVKCDLHPRWNRACNKVCVDSTHTGTRQVHIVDASAMKIQ